MNVASVYNVDGSNGNLNIDRFYYNHSTNECVSFKYGGINGNGNNFASKSICESVCKTSVASEHTPSVN